MFIKVKTYNIIKKRKIIKTISINSYGSSDELVSLKTDKFGFNLFVLVLPIRKLIEIMPDIDHVKRADTNRFVDKKHADEFGDYWLKNFGNWIIPPIMVVVDTHPKFDENIGIEGTSINVGLITLPKSFNIYSRVLDGQHRILGFRIAIEKLTKKRDELINKKYIIEDKMKENSGLIGFDAQLKVLENQLEELDTSLERFSKETVTLEIYSGVPKDKQMNFFTVISKNAKKIDKNAETKFSNDFIDIVTRKLLITNAELSKITNTYSENKGKKNHEVYTISDIKNIVQSILFSIDNSGYKKLYDYDLNSCIKVCNNFFNTLQKIKEYQIIAQANETELLKKAMKDMKGRSLAFSTPLVRSLAHAFGKNVIIENKTKVAGIEKISFSTDAIKLKDFENKIAAFDYSITNNKLNTFWYLTGHAPVGKIMLESKKQDLKGLSNKLDQLFGGSTLRLDNGKSASIIGFALVVK